MKKINVMDSLEFDDIVKKTYSKPYCFQQQEGCKDRGAEYFIIPTPGTDFNRDSIPEEVNGDIMGVSFKAWLERDPKKPLNGVETPDWEIDLFWERNFYPHPEILLNDLYSKGLIEAGELEISIDW